MSPGRRRRWRSPTAWCRPGASARPTGPRYSGRRSAEAEARGAPDTLDGYYAAVLVALERLCETRAGISGDDRAMRRAAWEAAYRRTPHGQPVEL